MGYYTSSCTVYTIYPYPFQKKGSVYKGKDDLKDEQIEQILKDAYQNIQ